jgi:hypothetical protein
MTKEDHSAHVKIKTGQPVALSLLSRTPMLLPGNSATSTQLPFSALHELFFQHRPADPSLSATVNSAPSYVIRGPIPKINRRSWACRQPLLAVVLTNALYAEQAARHRSMPSSRAQDYLAAWYPHVRHATRRRQKSSGLWRPVCPPAARTSAMPSWRGPRCSAASTVRPPAMPGTEVARRRKVGQPG